MFLDEIPVRIASVLLAVVGVRTISSESTIYLVDQQRAVRFEAGFTDWTVLFLLDVTYVFLVWMFLTVRGRSRPMTSYLTLGLLGGLSLYLGVGAKIFFQVYALANGNLASDGATMEFMVDVELLAYFLIVVLMTIITCAFLSWYGHRAGRQLSRIVR